MTGRRSVKLDLPLRNVVDPVCTEYVRRKNSRKDYAAVIEAGKKLTWLMAELAIKLDIANLGRDIFVEYDVDNGILYADQPNAACYDVEVKLNLVFKKEP